MNRAQKSAILKGGTYLFPALELLRENQRDIVFQVEGTSMLPLLKRGDRVALKQAPPHRLRRGELIAYRQGENIIVHRLIKKQQNNGGWRLCQKGDNLPSWGWIEENQLIGRAVSLEIEEARLMKTRFIKPLVNGLSLFFLSGWIGLREEAGRLKTSLVGERRLPLLARLDGRLTEIIGRAFIFIRF